MEIAAEPHIQLHRSSERACQHCGTRFRPVADEVFCCKGCRHVYQMIMEFHGERFYQLRDRVISPVKPSVHEPKDFSWLRTLIEQAENEAQSKSSASLTLQVQGVSCSACVWLIETLFQRQQGAIACETQPALGLISITWQPRKFDAPAFARSLQEVGYLITGRGEAIEGESQKLLLPMGICAALAMNNTLFSIPFYFDLTVETELGRIFRLATAFLALMSLLVGGSFFFTRAIKALRCGVLNMDVPISLGLLIAMLGSLYGWWMGIEAFIYFDFVSMFTFLMLVGRWVQEKGVEINRNRIRRADITGREVTLLDGTAQPISKLQKNDAYLLSKGQLVPVASELRHPAATFLYDWIHGEQTPRTEEQGKIIPSGAHYIGQEPIHLRAMESFPDSLLAKLVTVKSSLTRQQPFIDRLLRFYMGAVMAIAFLVAGAWIGLAQDPVQAAQSAISILIVSCPCAIGLAYPLVGEIAISRLRAAGLFIRDSGIWVKLKKIRRLVFDKTGTLTLEVLHLRNPETLNHLSTEDRVALYRLIQDSLHPIARSLREAWYQLPRIKMPHHDQQKVDDHPGLGIEWIDDQHNCYRLGKLSWSQYADSSRSSQESSQSSSIQEQEPYMQASFSKNGHRLATFYFSETLRPGVIEDLEILRKRGFDLYILSGDRHEKVQAMAEQLHIPITHAQGDMTPMDKARWIEEHDPASTLMIGDGGNDALAFDAALCSGTPMVDQGVLEKRADFYFLSQGLTPIVALFKMMDSRFHAARGAFIFSVIYNVAAISVAAMGWMSPLIAAVIMPLSSLFSVSLAQWRMRKD
jgi:Cu2+-exporting ATPase